MIIDIHAHVCAAPELYAWKDQIFSAAGALGPRYRNWDVDWIRDHPETKRNIAIMDRSERTSSSSRPGRSRRRIAKSPTACPITGTQA